MNAWLKNHKDISFFAGLVVAVLAIYVVGRNTPISAITTTWGWTILIMVLFLILVSAIVTDNPLFGWLINEQNRMSLSRLQMFMWTVLIMSAFVTAVLGNLHFKHYQEAVAIAIPKELWLAMGISITSLVGSGLIQEGKQKKEPKDLDLQENKRNGVLEKAQKPALNDLIRGEEVGNCDIIDLTRLQNLLITFVLIGTYAASLYVMFTTLLTVTANVPDVALNFPIKSFPELGSSAIALLTISHAGYLAAKAIDNQPSEQAEQENQPVG